MAIESIIFQGALVALCVLGVYIVLVRPQLQRIAVHEAFARSLKPGDIVVTAGGLIGKIVGLSGNSLVEIELAPAVRVKATRNSIERLFDENAPA
jgi:preprotein translocase subunit YajC